MVVERSDAHMVAGAEQLLPAAIPDGESEVAQQSARAVLAPALIRLKDQFRIVVIASAKTLRLERLPQFQTIVDPAIQGEAKSGMRVRERLSLVSRFGN